MRLILVIIKQKLGVYIEHSTHSIVDAEPIKNRFKEYLRSKGLSVTPQRREIVEYLCGESEHFDAETLINMLRNRNIAVSRATVYRTLFYLEDAGIIRKVSFEPGSHASYEFIVGSDHHEHVVCVSCGEIIEFSDPVLEHRINAVARRYGFTISRHMVQISGLCRRCREQQSKSRANM